MALQARLLLALHTASRLTARSRGSFSGLIAQIHLSWRIGTSLKAHTFRQRLWLVVVVFLSFCILASAAVATWLERTMVADRPSFELLLFDHRPRIAKGLRGVGPLIFDAILAVMMTFRFHREARFSLRRLAFLRRVFSSPLECVTDSFRSGPV